MSITERAAEKGEKYLLGEEWSEFSTLRHGPSTATDWVGGFIRRCLPDLPGVPTEVFSRFSASSSTDLDSEANWAKALGRPIKGWLSHLYRGNNTECSVATFNRAEIEAMYPGSSGKWGWRGGHFEVSALALLSPWDINAGAELQDEWWLSTEHRHDHMSFEDYVAKVLRKCRSGVAIWLHEWLNYGFDISYWWSTDAYGWHLCADLELVGELEIGREGFLCYERLNLHDRILERLEDSDPPMFNRYGEVCPFTMALNLMTLLRTEPGHSSIPYLAELLLGMQENNGSWLSPAILRIPEPNLVAHRDVEELKSSSTARCRRVAEDKGLLTTATVLQALKRYAQL